MTDSDVHGWLMMAGHAAAALACARAAGAARLGARLAVEPRTIERRGADRQRAYRASVLFWFAVTALMLLIGLDHLLGAVTWMTDRLRHAASDGGWYAERRSRQLACVLLLGAAAAGTLTVFLVRTRSLLPRHVPAFAGSLIVIVLLMLRAVSYHHLDAVLYRPDGSIGLGPGLEILGLSTIIGSAFTASRWQAERRRLGRPARTRAAGVVADTATGRAGTAGRSRHARSS